MKKLILAVILLAGMVKVFAQQDPMYTQYMFNTLSVNPAYAGSRELLNISGLMRAQWVGIKGAPLTQTLYAHTPFRSYSMGLGLSVVNDKIGPINQTLVFVDYSYTIKVTEGSKLAFGLKGGFNMLQGNLTQVATTEANDQAFSQNYSSKLLPNFGFGLYYHSDKWYIGASTPKLIENKIASTSTIEDAKEQRHYFIIGGVVLKLHEQVKFKPSFCYKLTQGAPVSWDVSGMFIFRDKLWLGAAYRWDDSFAAVMNIQLNEQLRVGYSYDVNISNLRKYNAGSHEIFLSYDFSFKRDRILSPRYF